MSDANVSLSALNDMLFEQLEKITNDDLNEEEIAKEERRTKIMTSISTQILQTANIELKAIRLYQDMIDPAMMPSVFGLLGE